MTRLACITILFLLSSCARAGASGMSAQEVTPPTSDTRCFVILEDGHAVGGNCILR